MKKLLSITLITLCIYGCDLADKKPVFSLQASFDPSMVDDVELFMEDISEKRGLKLFKKNRSEMQLVSNGQEAFFNAFYFKGDAILSLTNAGPGTILSLQALDYGELSLEKLEELTEEVRSGLKSEFNIDLVSTAAPEFIQ